MAQEVAVGEQYFKCMEHSVEAAVSVGRREVGASIADRLEALAIEARVAADGRAQSVPTQETMVELASAIYRARRRTDKIFGLGGFAVSPAWDIMLDLFQAREAGKPISVSSACIGAACPPTTALRWMHIIEEMHLIKRTPDPHDGRRIIVELTDAGAFKVMEALAIYS